MNEEPPSGDESVFSPETVSFREYRPTDSQRFFAIMASSWPKLTRSIHACSVDWYESSANWRTVASVSDNVVGILFGQTYLTMTLLDRLRMRFAHATVYMRLFLGLYGKVPGRLTVIKEAMASDRQIAASSEGADGEVTFFAVDASLRRKGIGRALMDRFIDYAKKTGAARISVYTIDPGSDLPFYERYGFRKIATFRDGFMSFATGEEVRALIYVLDL